MYYFCHGRRVQTIQKTKKKLRNNEYYNMQEVFDRLYADSKNGNNFYKLYEIITSKQKLIVEVLLPVLTAKPLKIFKNVRSSMLYKRFETS